MTDMRTWSRSMIIELLALYQSLPCLWKVKTKEYKSKSHKDEAYNKLIDFCRQKGFSEANRDFVVKKIQSLRGSFRKELNKVRNSQRTKKGADVYRSSLWYYKYLLFTKDQELHARSCRINSSEDDSLLHATSQPEKRKATPSYEQGFFKMCTDNLKTTNQGLSEFDVVGINIGKKLAKMDPVQAIYAESIMNNVIRKGLLRQLTENTDLFDSNQCTTTDTPNLEYPLQYSSEGESISDNVKPTISSP